MLQIHLRVLQVVTKEVPKVLRQLSERVCGYVQPGQEHDIPSVQLNTINRNPIFKFRVCRY